MSLYSEYGTIRTPQGTVESDDYDGSSSYIRLERIRIRPVFRSIRSQEISVSGRTEGKSKSILGEMENRNLRGQGSQR